MAVELNEPFLDGGINNAHFFNGRLLTAEALQDDQAANRIHRNRLGRGIGEGIFFGFHVATAPPDPVDNLSKTLSISGGLALNRNGRILSLQKAIDLTLTPPTQSTVQTGNGGFSPCEPVVSTPIASGKGVYILTASLASGYYEKTALLHGLAGNGIVSGCGYKYLKEGVRFRLVKMELDTLPATRTGITVEIVDLFNSLASGAYNVRDLSRFRNLLAHGCLGTPYKTGYLHDPFSLSNIGNESNSNGLHDRYGIVDKLRPGARSEADTNEPGRCLTTLPDEDVPLALVFWGENGIEFADMWAVRRRVHVPNGETEPLSPPVNRQTAEAEAAFFQFRDHLETLFRSVSDRRLFNFVTATDYFRYLPAAGIIPLDNSESDKTRREIDIKFFEDLSVRDPVFIEGAKMRELIRNSFSFPAIDLEKKELIWLYRVRENMQFFENNGRKQRQAVLLFTSGYIPFRGEAQYNLSRFDYSNYGPGVADKFIIGG